ncbi:MAG: hypothetical protein HOE73_03530 [Bacteroidetes Order II. Incertae sedis bacterium]|jgi:hypothetical protein|nr:hypothetical protein [Bacteroidetes Order II. bacterium]MBT4052142.1 hypothetical protein [Bacteroidetes Order II. bacterium]MBT5248599.1 hypothetical protein [Bacteroidetes Order II. bacterium]MBT6200378.1 hypothetical protein [Bacteroidetes Order II. bacterium]MBT6425264.1 hypothetical protein [Bacteroidetes Order II. bacterium]
MAFQNKSIIGWAFVMVATPALPLTASLVPEPSSVLVVGILIGIAIVAGFIGNLFKDED